MSPSTIKPPPGWALCTVGDVTELVATTSPAERPDVEFRYIDIASIDNARSRITAPKLYLGSNAPSRARQVVAENDTLFSTVRTYLKNIALVPVHLHGQVASTGFAVLRPSRLIEPRYLFHYTLTRDFLNRLTGLQRGSNYPAVRDQDVRSQPFPLPPSPEQRRIVAKIEELFSELDKGIENLKQARAQLAVYRQALLKHAFEGKLTAAWRKAHADKLEPADQLLARIRTERAARYEKQLTEWESAAAGGDGDLCRPREPSPWVDLAKSDLELMPPVPAGWAWTLFSNLCQRIRNGISAKPTGNTGVKILRISAVRPMRIDLDDFRFLHTSGNEYNDYLLQVGDLLFTRYNGTRDFVGVCGCFKGTEVRLFPDKLIQARIAAESVLPDFIAAAVSCGEPRKFIESRTRTTAGQAGVSGSDIKAVPVPVCSVAEQTEIVRILEETLPNIHALESEIDTNLQKCEALRQSILKKAFAGELVPQDPNDEPATELLARIRAERAAKPKSPVATPHSHGKSEQLALLPQGESKIAHGLNRWRSPRPTKVPKGRLKT